MRLAENTNADLSLKVDNNNNRNPVQDYFLLDLYHWQTNRADIPRDQRTVHLFVVPLALTSVVTCGEWRMSSVGGNQGQEFLPFIYLYIPWGLTMPQWEFLSSALLHSWAHNGLDQAYRKVLTHQLYHHVALFLGFLGHQYYFLWSISACVFHDVRNLVLFIIESLVLPIMFGWSRVSLNYVLNKWINKELLLGLKINF